MAQRDDPQAYGNALKERVPALERIFGAHEHYIMSAIPFYLGGDPSMVSFPDYLPGAEVWCTSEMTGSWGSGQQTGGEPECEFVLVIPKRSDLAPRVKAELKEPQVVAKGWTGVLLTLLAKYSCQALLRSGDTAGPLYPELVPMKHLLLHELSTSRTAFEFGGNRYRLMLCMLITEAELEFKARQGAAELVKRLRAAKAFPMSDTARASVC